MPRAVVPFARASTLALTLALALTGCGGGGGGGDGGGGDGDGGGAGDGGGGNLDGGVPGPDGPSGLIDAAPMTADANLFIPDAAICTTLAVTSTVPATMGAGTAPTPAGGNIADGTYRLSAVTRYGGTGALLTFGEALAFLSGVTRYERAVRFPGAAEDLLTSGTASRAGTSVTLTDTCGGRGMPVLPYTATASTFRSIVTQGGATYVFDYTRQP